MENARKSVKLTIVIFVNQFMDKKFVIYAKNTIYR